MILAAAISLAGNYFISVAPFVRSVRLSAILANLKLCYCKLSSIEVDLSLPIIDKKCQSLFIEKENKLFGGGLLK